MFALYGYAEIRTPVLEPTELFVRSVGESTDIVGKEMYTFADRKGRELALRPESTASVARAFVQHRLHDGAKPAKLFYIGPHFRYERPQRGRYRQFHQIGAELIGDPGPGSDAEVIAMLMRFLRALRFTGLQVLLHTVGDDETRSEYRSRLRAYLEPLAAELTEESRRRLQTNPLRILDTKEPREREILAGAPRLEEALTEASRAHFDGVRRALDGFEIPYTVEPGLVRGLDYYTHTVFEIVAEGLGAQNAIVGGGRYDGLIGELGGPALPGIGFAIGQDRMIDVLPKEFREATAGMAPIAVFAIEPVPGEVAQQLAEELRTAGFAAVAEFATVSARAGLKRAHRRGVKTVLLVGEDERAEGTVTVKNMESGEQRRVPRSELIGVLQEEA